MGTFWRKEFRHHGHFGKASFGTLQSNMEILAHKFWHLCYCVEISTCRNVPVVLKCSCTKNAGTSTVLNGACAEMFP
jgi:hypothetical protein